MTKSAKEDLMTLIIVFVAALLMFAGSMAHAGGKPPEPPKDDVIEIEIDNYVAPTAIGSAYSASHADADASAHASGGDAEARAYGGEGGEAHAYGGQGGDGGSSTAYGGEGGHGGQGGEGGQAYAGNEGNHQQTDILFEDAPSSAAPVFAGMCSSGASYQDKKFGVSVGTSNDVCVLLHAADAMYRAGHKDHALKLVCEAGRLARVKGYMGMVRAIISLGVL